MKFRDLRADLFDFSGGLKHVLALSLIILLLSSVSLASNPAPADDVRENIKKAAKLTRNDSLSDAEALLRHAVEIDPKRSDAKIELAYVLVKEHHLIDAYNICFPIAQAEPRNSRAFAVMGAILLSAGRFQDAQTIFINAIKLNRREDLAWAGLGMLDFYENNVQQSVNDLEEALYYKPNEPDYLFAFAQVAGRAEQFKEAAEKYERFLAVTHGVDNERRERIKGLISFLQYLGKSGKLYLPNGGDQTTVPFELVGDRPIINLRINDKQEPLRFVLDTGSGISVISETAAKRLKIKPITKGGYAKGIGGNGKFEIVYGLLNKVAIGDVSLRNVPVYLRRFQDGGQVVDGYIGLALISKFLTTIDYGNQTFSLTKKTADTRDFQRSDPLSLPLRLTSSGFLSGEVQLEGIDAILNFIVDTGASVSVISNRVAQADRISPFISDEKLRVIGSAGITDDVPSFLLPRITFGSHSRKSIMAIALDLDIINEASGFEQAGILGGNFLKNYRVTFDFKNSKVVFEPISPEN